MLEITMKTLLVFGRVWPKLLSTSNQTAVAVGTVISNDSANQQQLFPKETNGNTDVLLCLSFSHPRHNWTALSRDVRLPVKKALKGSLLLEPASAPSGKKSWS